MVDLLGHAARGPGAQPGRRPERKPQFPRTCQFHRERERWRIPPSQPGCVPDRLWGAVHHHGIPSKRNSKPGVRPGNAGRKWRLRLRGVVGGRPARGDFDFGRRRAERRSPGRGDFHRGGHRRRSGFRPDTERITAANRDDGHFRAEDQSIESGARRRHGRIDRRSVHAKRRNAAVHMVDGRRRPAGRSHAWFRRLDQR